MKILTTILLIGLTSVAFADGEGSWYESPQLLGRHESMEKSGISPFLYFDSIAAASVEGGIETADNFTSQVYAGLDLDLEKLFGWDGTISKISIVRSGSKKCLAKSGRLNSAGHPWMRISRTTNCIVIL